MIDTARRLTPPAESRMASHTKGHIYSEIFLRMRELIDERTEEGAEEEEGGDEVMDASPAAMIPAKLCWQGYVGKVSAK